MGLRLVDAATEDLGLGINMAGITRLRITRALYFDRPGYDELCPAMPATHFLRRPARLMLLSYSALRSHQPCGYYVCLVRLSRR